MNTAQLPTSSQSLMKIYFNIILPLPTHFSTGLTIELGSAFVMPMSMYPEFENNILNNKNIIIIIIITVHNIHRFCSLCDSLFNGFVKV